MKSKWNFQELPLQYPQIHKRTAFLYVRNNHKQDFFLVMA